MCATCVLLRSTLPRCCASCCSLCCNPLGESLHGINLSGVSLRRPQGQGKNTRLHDLSSLEYEVDDGGMDGGMDGGLDRGLDRGSDGALEGNGAHGSGTAAAHQQNAMSSHRLSSDRLSSHRLSSPRGSNESGDAATATSRHSRATGGQRQFGRQRHGSSELVWDDDELEIYDEQLQ